MIKLKTISLSNIRVFKDLRDFPLSGQGLVSIIGPNGIGKTTIFNCIRVVLFTAMNDSSKKDDLIRNKKDGSITLDFDKDGVPYRIDMSRVKNKWTVTIIEDGKDITPHSQAVAPKKPAEIIGMTDGEWDAAVHLSQRGSHILVKGKPSQRKEYIEEFFGLDSRYDEIQEASKVELKKVEEEIRRIESFATTKQALSGELELITLVDVSDTKDKLQGLKSSLAMLDTDLAAKRALIARAASYRQWAPLAYPEGYAHLDADHCYEYYVQQKAEIEGRMRNYSHAVSFNQRVEESNRKYLAARQYVEDNSRVKTQYPESYSTYASELNELSTKKKASSGRTALVSKLATYSHVEGLVLADTSEIESRIANLTAEYNLGIKQYQSVSAGQCPTCGSEFHSDKIHETYNTLMTKNEEIIKLHDSLAKLKEQNAGVTEYQKLRDSLELIPEFTGGEQLRIEELASVLPALKTYEETTTALANMTYAETMEVPTPATQTEIDACNNAIAFYKQMSDARKQCPEKPDQDEDVLGQQVQDLAGQRSQLEEEISRCNTEITVATEREQRFQRIKAQIDQIDDMNLKLPQLHEQQLLWSAMVQAYGPKGLRVQQLEKVMKLVLERLPVYTSRMFPDKSYKFSCEVDAGNISILVTREDGEGQYTYDIATLSGGEEKRMAVCLVLAIASVRLERKKINCVILDEVDSQIDKFGRYLFVNELLPMIREEFESVFVISHSEEMRQAAIYDKILEFSQSANMHYTEIAEIN